MPSDGFTAFFGGAAGARETVAVWVGTEGAGDADTVDCAGRIGDWPARLPAAGLGALTLTPETGSVAATTGGEDLCPMA